MIQHNPNCFILLRHAMPWALVFALASAGKSKPASMAMMAITTRSSMRVNPLNQEFFLKDSNGDWTRRSGIDNEIVRAEQPLQQERKRGYCAFQGTVAGFSLSFANEFGVVAETVATRIKRNRWPSCAGGKAPINRTHSKRFSTVGVTAPREASGVRASSAPLSQGSLRFEVRAGYPAWKRTVNPPSRRSRRSSPDHADRVSRSRSPDGSRNAPGNRVSSTAD